MVALARYLIQQGYKPGRCDHGLLRMTWLYNPDTTLYWVLYFKPCM
jgi:hypothetical protein